ncbi:MAG: tetratricopeptide repeat protein [Polyangiales bacterium]
MTEQDERWEQVEEGVELLETGAVDEAVAELLRAVEAHPENELAHCFLGNAFFEKEDYDRALKCYVAALERAPRYVGAMIGAGQTLRMLGQHDKALRMARQVLLVEKDDPDALYLAGCVHFQRGENHAAATYLQRFLETRPEIEVALEVEGMLKVLRGDVSPAVDEPLDDSDD